jgi:chromosomal replication initiation ATPase DnaA
MLCEPLRQQIARHQATLARINAPREIVEKTKPRPFHISHQALLALNISPALGHNFGYQFDQHVVIYEDSKIARLVERSVSLITIIKVVAYEFGVTPEQILGRRRTENIIDARFVALRLARLFTRRTVTDLGERFGGRDHTTVCHSLSSLEEKTKRRPALAERFAVLERRLSEAAR